MSTPSDPQPNDRTLLIVDDDLALSQTLKRSLEGHGYQVESCQNSESTLKIAEQLAPSYCLLDLKIAEESGLKLIEPLLNTRNDMQIVMMTGYASISTVVEAMKLGASNYLAKPIDTAAVIKVLENNQANADLPLDQDPMSVRRLEWEHIQSVLAKNEGNISATARDLNMHRRTLQRKLNQKPSKQ